MAFNDLTEFPRNTIRIDALTNVAKVIAAGNIRIVGILVSEQAGAAEVLRFREADDSPEYFSINIAANETKFFPIRVNLTDVEVITDSAANVDVTIFAFGDVVSTTVV